MTIKAKQYNQIVSFFLQITANNSPLMYDCSYIIRPKGEMHHISAPYQFYCGQP